MKFITQMWPPANTGKAGLAISEGDMNPTWWRVLDVQKDNTWPERGGRFAAAQRDGQQNGHSGNDGSGTGQGNPAATLRASPQPADQGIAALMRNDLDHANGMVDALQPFQAALQVTDALDLARQVHDAFRGEHLARRCQRAQPRRHVQRTTAIARTDRNRLTCIQPNADTPC